ncbi:mechanosensitive ion channel family protein [Sporosarcina siberiensis]|uniref:Mechanosensitive ion channel family protein n=1 Tax=Sporosarcina siberiensis TaxID=1365606 RepID=A0ABW4SFK5_9BACL
MPEFLLDYFSGLAESLQSTLNTPDAYLNKIALTVVIIILSLSIYIFIKKLITRTINDFMKKLQLKNVAKNTMVTLTIVAVLFIWVQAINVLILLALLFGVIAVFMVRGLTNNLVGYFVIRYRQYFQIGHRIEINGIIGDVVDINLINFKLLEVRHGLSSDASTGRVIKLPNSIVFNESIEMIGITNSFIWHELKYTLSFDSDWQAAEKIMVDAGNTYFEETVVPELKEKNNLMSNESMNSKPVFSIDTNTEGIVVVLRYMVNYNHATKVKTAFQRKILPQFNDNLQINYAIIEVKVFQD